MRSRERSHRELGMDQMATPEELREVFGWERA